MAMDRGTGRLRRPCAKSRWLNALSIAVLEVAFKTTLTVDSHPDRPRSQVSLLWGPPGGERREVSLDQVTGECGPPSAQAPREAIEVLYLQCWWGGQGMDYRLIRRGDALVVERQYQAEEIGLGDEDPFEAIHHLPVAPTTRVRPGRSELDQEL